MSIKTSSDHRVEHLGFPEASVEAVTKLSQITGQVLVTDAMIDPTDIAFDVGDQGMDPGKQSDCVFSRTSHDRYMKARLRVQDPIGLPTICAGHHLCCQANLSHGLISLPLTLGTWRIAANRGSSPGVSTATTTLDLPAAPRLRLPGLGQPT